MMSIVFSRVSSQSTRASSERVIDRRMPRTAQLGAGPQRPMASASAPTALIPARGSKSSTRVATAGFEVSISVSATDHLDGVFSGAHRAFWRARQVVFGVSIFAGLADLDEVISGAQPAIFGPRWIDSAMD